MTHLLIDGCRWHLDIWNLTTSREPPTGEIGIGDVCYIHDSKLWLLFSHKHHPGGQNPKLADLRERSGKLNVGPLKITKLSPRCFHTSTVQNLPNNPSCATTDPSRYVFLFTLSSTVIKRVIIRQGLLDALSKECGELNVRSLEIIKHPGSIVQHQPDDSGCTATETPRCVFSPTLISTIIKRMKLGRRNLETLHLRSKGCAVQQWRPNLTHTEWMP